MEAKKSRKEIIAKAREVHEREAKYSPQMGEDAYQWKLTEGLSNHQVAARLKISRKVFNRWMTDVRKREFGRHIEKGEEAAEAYHETKLQQIAAGEIKGNVVAQMYYMRVRFRGKWQQDGTNNSKIEVEHKYSNMSPVELASYVKNRLALTKKMGITIDMVKPKNNVKLVN